MTTTQHTPGPWAHMQGMLVTANADGTIRLNSRVVTEYRVPPTIQDARLIAAAPELLHALEIVVYNAEAMKLFDRNNAGEIIRAAIAKATGGEG